MVKDVRPQPGLSQEGGGAMRLKNGRGVFVDGCGPPTTPPCRTDCPFPPTGGRRVAAAAPSPAKKRAPAP